MHNACSLTIAADEDRGGRIAGLGLADEHGEVIWAFGGAAGEVAGVVGGIVDSLLRRSVMYCQVLGRCVDDVVVVKDIDVVLPGRRGWMSPGVGLGRRRLEARRLSPYCCAHWCRGQR